MATKSYAQRNIDAEGRAVEEGHRAYLIEGEQAVRVVSDTHHDKWYRVEAAAGIFDGLIRFRCRPQGNMAYRDDHLDTLPSTVPGLAPCKHAALGARKLERHGLAVLRSDGLWHSTAPPHAHEYIDGRCECGMPSDPFDGLPS